ncbi:hypothetical protein ACUNV4_20190 [Granulosicoccus sp. 3-233]|uniref:hypothetical protein n=1 Tax=Granulosicoccus sp. 3-233 TaxID=3417969 RepID=UPI003D34DB74
MSEGQAPQSKTREQDAAPGFFRRYRLPLFLAAVALCLYAGSIIYILYFRGQVA